MGLVVSRNGAVCVCVCGGRLAETGNGAGFLRMMPCILQLDGDAACRGYDCTKANGLNTSKWLSWSQACSLVLEQLLGMTWCD